MMMNDLIEKLSNLRCQFNCFDEDERDTYHTLSEAIKVVREIDALPSAQPEPLTLPNIYVAKDCDAVKDENENVGFGVYIPDEKQIYVAGNVPHEIFVKALFHELFHWMQDVAGRLFDENEANAFAERIYEALSSAQLEQSSECQKCYWSDEKGCAIYCRAWNRYTAHKGYCHQWAERREND